MRITWKTGNTATERRYISIYEHIILFVFHGKKEHDKAFQLPVCFLHGHGTASKKGTIVLANVYVRHTILMLLPCCFEGRVLAHAVLSCAIANHQTCVRSVQMELFPPGPEFFCQKLQVIQESLRRPDVASRLCGTYPEIGLELLSGHGHKYIKYRKAKKVKK